MTVSRDWRKSPLDRSGGESLRKSRSGGTLAGGTGGPDIGEESAADLTKDTLSLSSLSRRELFG